MSLENFYKLRENFIVLGLTGKMQSGASELKEILSENILTDSNRRFMTEFPDLYKQISHSESIKYKRVSTFFSYQGNWKKFDVIEYKYVILLFILGHNYNDNTDCFATNISTWIKNLGTYKDFQTPRFCSEKSIAKGSTEYINSEFLSFLKSSLKKLNADKLNAFKDSDLHKEFKTNSIFFDPQFNKFAKSFFDKLDEFSVYLRHKLIHVTSYCLRKYGTLDIKTIEEDKCNDDRFKDIYKIAKLIDAIIKHRRKNQNEQVHIIIDRLKNSYELNYFREKYSGYYTIALNRKDDSRINAIEIKITKNCNSSRTSAKDNLDHLKNLDHTEYLISEFKDGKFEGFDIENCVQKADYHIWYDELFNHLSFYEQFNLEDGQLTFNNKKLEKTNEYYIYQPLLIQILKLIALIQQPGMITPTYLERIMQLAYNTKLSSGCVSRQVGAVITDENFSVKSVGWNEVANGQIPCSSRDVRELIDDDFGDKSVYTPLELGETNHKYKDSKTFKEKIKDDLNIVFDDLKDNLKGRPCTFCFKSHHNAYEAKENQVHTRSLHAEENAMLQISKYGGQALIGGNLFTTASTCELCAKKAYQLGVKNIFYIDVYPGISNDQILNSGNKKPNIYAYQGAIGRGFNKLYEQFMAPKDEINIRTKFKPTISQKEQASQLQSIIGSKINSEDIVLIKHLNSLQDDPDIIEKMVELMKKGLEKQN